MTTKIVSFAPSTLPDNTKPIELRYYIVDVWDYGDPNAQCEGTSSEASWFNFVALVNKASDERGLDLISCWDTDSEKLFFLGKWNSGAV